jgi:2-polyprenyl-6-hydroxyphenyl methylase/3-demethylubiquinone-9 3-methyltransferase
VQFDFGQNWADFSGRAATPERANQARRDFSSLMENVNLRGQSFLDIGFGQGFSLLAAASLGARVAGCDINPKCRTVLDRNLPLFPELVGLKPDVELGSILDPEVVQRLRSRVASEGGFDVVHSWGVLHHTGDMRRAIEHAATLVRPAGVLVIAIYNRHWSSPAWSLVKWLYGKSPRWVQHALVYMLYPVIWFAKLIVTGSNPRAKERGMDFFYDVIDWVGGYPYETMSVEEVSALCELLGFKPLRVIPARVPTGCNEFVLRRERDAASLPPAESD